MPEYYVIANDPSTHPDYAYNERLVSTETFLIYDNRVHTPEMSSALEYTRFRITTEYYDVYGMSNRKPASSYYGSLRPAGYEPSRLKQYVPAGIAAVLSSTQSGGGSSLPSTPKIPGKSYKPGKGKKCRPGYQLINGMCVLRKKRTY